MSFRQLQRLELTLPYFMINEKRVRMQWRPDEKWHECFKETQSTIVHASCFGHSAVWIHPAGHNEPLFYAVLRAEFIKEYVESFPPFFNIILDKYYLSNRHIICIQPNIDEPKKQIILNQSNQYRLKRTFLVYAKFPFQPKCLVTQRKSLARKKPQCFISNNGKASGNALRKI